MATRCYFPSTTAADVTPVASGSWGYTSEALNRKLVPTTKSDTAIAIGTQIGAWTAGQNALDRRYVSAPLSGAQTVSGTVKMQLMAREYNNGDNSTSRMEIYVVHNDGQTVRGTCLAIGQYGPTSEYVNNATHRNKTFADGDSLTSVSASDGDRIVVAVGHSDATGATPEGSCKFGDPTATSDLPENETQTTDGVGWIEFSANLTFQTSTTFPQALPATEVSAPTIVRKASKFVTGTAPGVATFVKKVSKFVVGASPGVTTFVRKVLKSLAGTAPGVATMTRARIFVKTLAALGASAPVLLAKQVIVKVLSVASAGVATLVKVLLNLKTLGATQVSVATLGKYRSFGTPFLYTASNYSGVNFYLEVNVRASSGSARARLFDVTSNLAVAGSEVTTASSSFVRLRSSGLSLQDGHEYMLQLGTIGVGVGEIRGLPRIIAADG